MFSLLDSDASGTIDAEELGQVFSAVDVKLTRKVMQNKLSEVCARPSPLVYPSSSERRLLTRTPLVLVHRRSLTLTATGRSTLKSSCPP